MFSGPQVWYTIPFMDGINGSEAHFSVEISESRAACTWIDQSIYLLSVNLPGIYNPLFRPPLLLFGKTLDEVFKAGSSLHAALLQSCPTLFNSMDYSLQAPLSMGISRQEYRNGLPCPPPGDLPNPGMETASLTSPSLAGWFFTTRASLLYAKSLLILSTTQFDLQDIIKTPSHLSIMPPSCCRWYREVLCKIPVRT